MRLKKYIELVFLAVIILIFTGCSNYAVKYEYTDQTEMVEIYNAVDEPSDWLGAINYSTVHADYYFVNLDDKQKDFFVDTTEQVLNDYPADKVKFVVGNSFNTAYVGKVRNAKNTEARVIDTFYFNIEDTSCLNILIELNARRYGETTPYGLLYAYSYGQCVAANYDIPRILSNEKLQEAVNSNKDIVDLNTFVFLSNFTSETEKQAAQTLAVKLYEMVGLDKIKDIIECESASDQQALLNLFLKTTCYYYGITTHLDSEIGEWLFYHTNRYVVAENIDFKVRFFIEPNYVKRPYEPKTYMQGYSDLKTYLIKLLPSFAMVNEFVENASMPYADFFLSSNYEHSQAFDNMCVKLNNFILIIHEYCHIAMMDKARGDINWAGEVIAEYCATMSDYYTEWILFSCIDYMKNDDEDAKFAFDLIQKYSPATITELWDILAYAYEYRYPNNELDGPGWVLPKRIAPSFCNYLINTYGKEKFLQICTKSYSTAREIYGKTLNELREDWFASLQVRFE